MGKFLFIYLFFIDYVYIDVNNTNNASAIDHNIEIIECYSVTKLKQNIFRGPYGKHCFKI